MTKISDHAFYYDSTMKYLIIPKSVTEIGGYTFYNWTIAQTVYFEAESSREIALDQYWLSSANMRIVWNARGPLFLDATAWDDEDATERYVAYFYDTTGTNEAKWAVPDRRSPENR